MPKLQEIFISNREPWAKELIEILKEKELPYALIIRKDSINSFEVPETSISTARLLRMYENLPVDKPLFFKKSPHDKLMDQIDAVLEPADFKDLREILKEKKSEYPTRALRQTANCTDLTKFEKAVKVANLLLLSGLAINVNDHQKSKSQMTALHYAAENNNEALYKFLRSKDAKEDIPDAKGRTARSILEEKQAGCLKPY